MSQDGADSLARATSGSNPTTERILPMDGAGLLPREAFSVQQATVLDAGTRAPSTFQFQRNVRRSIMLDLGVHRAGESAADTDVRAASIFDPYHKASETDCIMLYTCVVIGVGSFSLSEAIHKCGIVFGLLALLSFCMMHEFFCHRLVEIPNMVQKNMETYSDLSSMWFGTTGQRVMGFLAASSFFGACMINLITIIENVECMNKGEVGPIPKMCLCAFVLVPTLCCLGFRGLSRVAYYGICVMCTSASLEIVCAVYNGVKHRLWLESSSNHDNGSIGYKWFPDDFGDIISGMHDMGMAFGGIGLIPYLVAGMLRPQEAKRMTSKACRYIMSYYFAIASLCYFGWGAIVDDEDDVCIGLFEMLMKRGPALKSLGHFLSCLLLAKTVLTYPLYFWPILRELEHNMPLDEAPGVELGLPWALRQVRRVKKCMKLGLVCLTLLPVVCLPSSALRSLKAFAVCVPINLAHFIIPAIVPLSAAYIRWKTLTMDRLANASRVRGERLTRSASSLTNSRAFRFVGGSLSWHVVITACLALLVVSYGASLLFSWLCWGDVCKDAWGVVDMLRPR